MKLENCWEIKDCGRGPNGSLAAGQEMCSAPREGLGHSCWTIAGTLSGRNVECPFARRLYSCGQCEVYGTYHRIRGSRGPLIPDLYPEEHAKYIELLKNRLIFNRNGVPPAETEVPPIG